MNVQHAILSLQGFKYHAGFSFCKKYRTFFLLVGILFFTQMTYAQKIVKKSVISSDVSFITIDVNNCFDMKTKTHKTNEIIVEASIDGEYSDDLLINIKNEGSSIHISAEFQPNFVDPNDKLSAHKVISIAIDILLPEDRNIEVFGTNCNVDIRGDYENVKVSLDDGNCRISKVSKSVEVSTQSGDISAEFDSADGSAKSKYGNVIKEKIPKGNNTYIFQTVTGDIILKRVE